MRFPPKKQLFFLEAYLRLRGDAVGALHETYPASMGWARRAQQNKASALLNCALVQEGIREHARTAMSTAAEVVRVITDAELVAELVKTARDARAAGDWQSAIVGFYRAGELLAVREGALLARGLNGKGEPLQALAQPAPVAFVDAPPQETYEQWVARREGGLESSDGAAGGGDEEDLG